VSESNSQVSTPYIQDATPTQSCTEMISSKAGFLDGALELA